MKFHWGNMLIIAFIAFGGMIILLVYKSINSNYDMVSKEYYKEELLFQEIINAKNNAENLTDSIRYHQDQKQMIITLPAEIQAKQVLADLHFYCAYDAQKDKKMQLAFIDGMSNPIALKELDAGTYMLKMRFKANDLEYYQEKEITIQN